MTRPNHPAVQAFLEAWVHPTGFSGPGVEFRRRMTERCLPVWNGATARARKAAEADQRTPGSEWKRERALAGYALEGPQMSIKQMSTQLLSVPVAMQERYIDLQRLRARQIWDEMKHGQLNADVLQRGGWIQREEELMDDVRANAQDNLAYFGLTSMFAHIHPLARAAQNYFVEALAYLSISVTLEIVEDPLIRHQMRSQQLEELMHFMQGKFQLDAYALTAEEQKPIEEAFDFLLKPWATRMNPAFGGRPREAAR
ncbi:MAG TPA: hypothetical protein VEL75_12510 [Candidatus Methylomirabilis sp.]|nr:hypothetical protein [Candidatus Methylomirabilis sp.]